MPPRTRVPAFARAWSARRSLRFMLVVLVIALAILLGATIATGRVAPSRRPVDPALLVRVSAPLPAASSTAPRVSAGPVVLGPIDDFPAVPPRVGARPAPHLRQPVGVIVVPLPTPTPVPARARSASAGSTTGVGRANRVSGTASWYCQPGVSPCHRAYPGGFYAAAGPALRVGSWRGRAVRVCGGGGCVTVRLVDWCQCYGSRVIDLYSDAFRVIAPLSAGTTHVTVSW